MQKVLDSTQESLAQAFAALARNARRQQRLAIAMLALLIALGLASVAFLIAVANVAQLRYRWTAIAVGIACLLIVVVGLVAWYGGMRLARRTHAEAERALESETLNHILVSATPIGLCIVRQGDFSILTSNDLAKLLLHVELPAGMPSHIVDAFRQQAAHEASGAGFAKIARFTVSAVDAATPGVEPQFLQITYAPARYRAEDVLFCAIIDTTTQQLLEQRLRSAQLASEATMRARSNFFASMSHEIRTPLNALLGNLELLAQSPGLDAHEQRLRALDAAAGGLRRIVNDILDFSKVEAGELKLVSEAFRPIDDFESLSLSYAPLADGRPLRYHVGLWPSLDQVVYGDRARIAQIVNNLLSNAFKFTSIGKITLSADIASDASGRPTLTCRVCDSGIGMEPSLVARLFTPFVQAEAGTANRYGGTGLGLSISAKLCDLMGGQITVESVRGVGTAFNVTIPLQLRDVESAGSDAPSDAPAVKKRGTVLVLVMETETVPVGEQWLIRAGWFVNSVLSVSAAQAYLDINAPDVMLVSGAFGLDVVEQLRARRRNVPVLWVTRTGPHRPRQVAEGVLEVSEFSHEALLSGMEAAFDGATKDTLHSETAPEPSSSPSSSSSSAPQAEQHDAPALSDLRVLVAEDNLLNQTLIAEQLTKLGCKPLIVSDGRQALAVVDSTPIDVVLTDIHMPVMNGSELLSALRTTHAGLPVFAFSASVGYGQTQDARDGAFDGYVAKPASLKQLEAFLRSAAELQRAPETTSSETWSSSTLDDDEKARMLDVLKAYLRTDLPKLLAIVERQSREDLREWAHSAAGAFLVMQERELAQTCRALQDACDEAQAWLPEFAAHALDLYARLAREYGIDDTASAK